MNDAPSKFFFRQRQQNRLYDTVVTAMEDAAKHRNLRKKDIAEKLGVNPSQVTRWLSGPANWETDTISDLMFAIDAELDFQVVPFADRKHRKSNRSHALGDPAKKTAEPIATMTTTTTTASVTTVVMSWPNAAH